MAGALQPVQAQQAKTLAPPPVADEIGKYLIIGMKAASDGDAVNVNSSNELGANRSFLSGTDPNTYDVFEARWNSIAAGTVGAKSPDENPIPSQPDGTPTGSAPVFQGIDWSGNVAITNSGGAFSMSDIDVYAALGVQCDGTPCHQSVSNTRWFENGNTTDSGNLPTVGVSSFSPTALLNELADWKTYIQGLTAECTITSDITNTGATPFVTDVDACDANNDGIVVFDINRGGNDFDVDNADWILDGSADKLAILRITGGSNFTLSNSAILLGDGGIGGSFAPVSRVGAIFFKGDSEGSGSSDQVFNFNNVILNGIGLWDLVKVGNASGNKTEININNGQGCAQFISQTVTFNDVRWIRCAPVITPAFDFGDAPDSYGTHATSNGPHHLITTDLFLGSEQPDADPGTLSATTNDPAVDDDNHHSGSADDEDGKPPILVNEDLPPGSFSMDVRVTNSNASSATLACWIDFDANGTFEADERGEAPVPAGTTPAGPITVSFLGAYDVAGQGSIGYYRCRVAFVAGEVTLPTGQANSGEVEDCEFTLLPPGGTLPVELGSFEALTEDRHLVLSWTTLSETDNAGFFIEYAWNERAFQTAGFVEGAGTTDATRHYSYRMTALSPGTYRVRLKQVDFDGGVDYSQVLTREVTLPGSHLLEAVYPNPFSTHAQVRFTVSQAQPVQVSVYDMLGRQVRVLYAGWSDGNVVQQVDLYGKGLPGGTYLVRLAGETFTATQRFVVVK